MRGCESSPLDPSMAQPPFGAEQSHESNNDSLGNERCEASAPGGALETFGLSVSSRIAPFPSALGLRARERRAPDPPDQPDSDTQQRSGQFLQNQHLGEAQC